MNFDSPPHTESDESDDLEEVDDYASNETEEWKNQMRHDFDGWLESLDAIPDELTEDFAEADSPDLVTLFGDVSSLALESRKANRRTADAFTKWNTVLTDFQNDMSRLRERERALVESLPQAESVSPPVASFLVDLYDRLNRITKAQQEAPTAKVGFFGNDTPWRTAWQNQYAALDISLSHLHTFLTQNGFQMIQTSGQLLDPTRMTVVDARLTTAQAPHTVIEEILPGWMLGNRVLRPAQVIVATPPHPQTSL